MLFKRKNKMG